MAVPIYAQRWGRPSGAPVAPTVATTVAPYETKVFATIAQLERYRYINESNVLLSL